ncbi:MAG: hypothetical protein ACP5LC_02515 [Thermoplasmata archaeon]
MRSLTIMVGILVLAMAMVPLASGAQVNATINTHTNVANVNATSNYVMVLNYPNGSMLSQALSGKNFYLNGSSTITSSSIGVLDQSIENESNNSTSGFTPHVVNATILYSYKAVANNTTMKVYRNLTLEMSITNILKKVDGHYVIDMSWRAFRVQGELMSTINGREIDVNDMGAQMFLGEDFGDHTMGIPSDIKHMHSLDFQIFNVPLSQWNKQYNSTSNVTIFSYNYGRDIWYNSSWNFSSNGGFFGNDNNNSGNYSISIHYDPSSEIAVTGYANVNSANTLVVENSSTNSYLGLNSESIIAGVLITIIIIIAALGVVLYRRKK